LFAERVVGLKSGAVVYDGSPEGLTPDVLTQIYGEEDWNATKEDGDKFLTQGEEAGGES
jgi:phosphonate transport system ATP-binding protein